MTTITEDYVSFEIAKLLKEKGFNERCLKQYYNNGELSNVSIEAKYNTIVNQVSAPTLQMVMKWLREVHEIAIVIDCWFGGENYINWHGKIMCYGEKLKTQQDVDMPYVATYEKACEATIKYCIENLI